MTKSTKGDMAMLASLCGHPGDTAERFFALGFSLEQMHQNLCDLDRVVGEWSEATADGPVKIAE